MEPTDLRLHASIDAASLEASIAFYRALFGTEPALARADYARFELARPPLVLGLNAVDGARSHPGPLQHLGLMYGDRAELERASLRLEQLGVELEREAAVECCYARLDRTWASDPSGVRWELFHPLEELVESVDRSGTAEACCEPGCCAGSRG